MTVVSPRTFAQFCLAALLAPFVVEFGIFLNPKAFWGTPTGLDTYAWSCFRAFEGSAIRQGLVPFWNPYVLNGVPWQGWVTNVIHPGSILHWFNLSPGLFCKISIYSALVWGYLGSSMWCKSQGRSDIAALGSGMLFAHGGFMMGQLYAGHLEIVVALSWSPWLAWSAERYWNSPGFSNALIVSVTGALLMLSGSMQIFYLTYTAVSLYGLLRTLFAASRLKLLVAPVCGWLGGSLMMTLLTAFQWFPLLQARAYCNRPDQDADYYTSFSGTPENLLSWVFPHFFDSSSYDRFWTNPAYWEGCEYLGMIGLAFLVAGIVRPGPGRLASLVVVFISCLIAYDSSSTLLRAYVDLGFDPAVVQFRCPARFLVWFHLYAVPLVASGIDGWIDREHPACLWVTRILQGLLVFYFINLCLLELLSPTNLVWLKFCRALSHNDAISPSLAATLYVSQYGRALWMFFLSFCILVGWRAIQPSLDRSNPEISRATKVWWILALIAFDLASIVRPWLTTASSDNFGLNSSEVSLIQKGCPGGQRLELPLPKALQGMTIAKEELSGFLPVCSLAYQEYWRTAMKRWRPNLEYKSFIALFASPSPPALATFFNCNQAFVDGHHLKHWKSQFPRILEANPNPGGWSLISSPEQPLLQFERTAPDRKDLRSRFAFHTKAVFLPDELIYARLAKDSDQERPLWLPSRELKNLPSATDDAVDWSVSDLELGINTIQVVVRSTRAGYFTTRDAFWPGWEAWSDGVPTTVLPSYGGLCRTVRLAPGTHQLRFRFRPQYWDRLLLLSTAGWLLILSVGSIQFANLNLFKRFLDRSNPNAPIKSCSIT
jgi:hypothetical protein